MTVCVCALWLYAEPGTLPEITPCVCVCVCAAGERNERIDQLEEDIMDMKAIFHAQLELCVDQMNRAQERGNTAALKQGGAA